MQFAPAFPSLARHWLAAILAAVLTMLPMGPVSGPALAQGEPEFFEQPYAEGQWNIGRRLNESQFRYCVDKRDGDWEVAAAIADAIAGALLLEPQRYVVDSEIVQEDVTRVYALLLEHCDVHMGFKLIPEGYGNWAMLTRPYYDAQYVFVASDPALQALADLPPGRAIGATIGTSAHVRLMSYLTALPAEQRWPAFPMGTNGLALESLRNGVVDVALVWAPEFWARQRQDEAFAEMHVIAPDPLPPTVLPVGGLLLSKETFLRSAVDEAIAALRADGSLTQILEDFDFPAIAAP